MKDYSSTRLDLYTILYETYSKITMMFYALYAVSLDVLCLKRLTQLENFEVMHDSREDSFEGLGFVGFRVHQHAASCIFTIPINVYIYLPKWFLNGKKQYPTQHSRLISYINVAFLFTSSRYFFLKTFITETFGQMLGFDSPHPKNPEPSRSSRIDGRNIPSPGYVFGGKSRNLRAYLDL